MSSSRKIKQKQAETEHAPEVKSLNAGEGNGDMISFMCSWNILPLISPYSSGLLAWQIVLMVLIVYSALVVPFELAFGMMVTALPILVLHFRSAPGCTRSPPIWTPWHVWQPA
jgi:hypothetical protein